MSAGSNGFKIKELSEWVCQIEICEVLLYFLFWHHIWLVFCWPICCFTLNFMYIYFNYAITHFGKKSGILYCESSLLAFVLSVFFLFQNWSLFRYSLVPFHIGIKEVWAATQSLEILHGTKKKLAGFFLELIHLERAKKTKMKIWKKKKDKRKKCDLNSKCGVWV